MKENQISSSAASLRSLALNKEISQQRVSAVYRAAKFWGYALFIKPSMGNMKELGIQNHFSCCLVFSISDVVVSPNICLK